MPFFCEYCQFSAPNKYRYERHLATKKHARNYAAHYNDDTEDNSLNDEPLNNTTHDITQNTTHDEPLDNDADYPLHYSSLFHNAVFFSFFFSFANNLLNNRLFIFCSSFFNKHYHH